jgi:hypothetical protein
MDAMHLAIAVERKALAQILGGHGLSKGDDTEVP